METIDNVMLAFLNKIYWCATLNVLVVICVETSSSEGYDPE
jgi:hypothetical protein